MLLTVHWNTSAAIGHTKSNLEPVGTGFSRQTDKSDSSRGCKLGRVTQEIGKILKQKDGITDNIEIVRVRSIEAERDSCPHTRALKSCGLATKNAEINDLVLGIVGTVLHLRHIEHIVESVDSMLTNQPLVIGELTDSRRQFLEALLAFIFDQGQINSFGSTIGKRKDRSDNITNLVIDMCRNSGLGGGGGLSSTLLHLGISLGTGIGNILTDTDHTNHIVLRVTTSGGVKKDFDDVIPRRQQWELVVGCLDT
mmetsp:Transcript_20542/g.48518  ORF Transcript_20542/g.48518 Transcript_20542/m.48518 type:complete len:253 (+) Transcript_20542:1424-2182(+)